MFVFCLCMFCSGGLVLIVYVLDSYLCTCLTGGPVLLMEYCEQGQLDKWLISMSSEYSEQMFGLLLGFSIEIANAMMFLSSEDVITFYECIL